MSDNLDILIRGDMTVTGAGIVCADVGIRGEQVAEIAAKIAPERARRVIDAPGKVVLPGVYEGREVTGKPVLTMQRGAVIVEDGNLLATPGRARFLATDTSHLYR